MYALAWFHQVRYQDARLVSGDALTAPALAATSDTPSASAEITLFILPVCPL
jgi:hypothetical protein